MIARFIILTLLCLPAIGATVRLEWDPSPDAWVSGYRIHAGTNSGAYCIRVDAGTNTTCTVSNLTAGLWYFVATAYTTNGIESLPSNEVVAQIAKPPENMRTVIAEWSGEVASTNWQNAGFLRIKFGP